MENRKSAAGNTLKWVVGGLAALVVWLQYNSGFATASYVLLAIGAALFFLCGAIVIIAHGKIYMDGIVHLKEAESKIKVAEMNQMRVDNKTIAQQVTQQTRWLLAQSAPYWKAKYQLDARPVEQEQMTEEYRPLDYDDDQL